MEKTTLLTVLVGVLLAVSVMQALQLGSLSSSQQAVITALASQPVVAAAPVAAVQAPAGAGGSGGGALGSLPDMVGGC